MRIVRITTLLLICGSALAQPNEQPEWEQVYGVNNTSAVSIIQTSDGGYVAAGNTEDYGAGQSDFYLVKMDSLGHPEWARTFGSENREILTSVHETFDGGFILAGYCYQNAGQGGQPYAVKTDQWGITTRKAILLK